MDVELSILRTITSALPRIRGAGFLGNAIRRFYARKPRAVLKSKVLDFDMLLDPCECVDGGLLFYPDLYDRREISFLRRVLRPGDTFLDIGANIGFYSLIASSIVGPSGQVISVEADPDTAMRLKEHLKINRCRNSIVYQVGISDKYETLSLAVNQHGNRGGSSFLADSNRTIPVDCQPLAEFLASALAGKVARLMKMDIEGMELRVMRAFMSAAPKDIWPEYLIIEDNQNLYNAAGGEIVPLLESGGYKVIERCSGINVLMTLAR
jgi:FkbM family methyltransferase